MWHSSKLSALITRLSFHWSCWHLSRESFKLCFFFKNCCRNKTVHLKLYNRRGLRKIFQKYIKNWVLVPVWIYLEHNSSHFTEVSISSATYLLILSSVETCYTPALWFTKLLFQIIDSISNYSLWSQVQLINIQVKRAMGLVCAISNLWKPKTRLSVPSSMLPSVP